MYLATRPAPRAQTPALPSGGTGRRGRIGMATVLLLGVTSLLTDLSSEMVTSTLPLMLAFQLRFSPLQLGLIEGLAQAASAVVRLAGGRFADRRRRHKEVATAGYALSAASRVGLLWLPGSWLAVTGSQMVDRLGKGIRTAPRDAMISLSVPRERLGWAFGVHRCLDGVGAMLGPLVAFGLLMALPGAYSTVVALSACIGVVGVAVIALLVRAPAPGPGVGNPGGLEIVGSGNVRPGWASILRTPSFARVMGAATLLALCTVGDAFVYLSLHQRANFTVGWFPLLYVGTAAVYLLSAPSVGRLADHLGRRRLVLAGHALLLSLYLLLTAGSISLPVLLLALVVFGLYYAATDGVLAALASATLAPSVRATGLATLATAVSVARMGAAVLFGLLWTETGNGGAIRWFAGGLALAWIGAAVLLRPTEECP